MGFLDNLKKGVNDIADKTNDFVSDSKTKMDIKKIKGDIDVEFRKLGERFYQYQKDGIEVDESVLEFVSVIDQKYEEIKELEKSLEEQKVVPSGTVKCPNCSNELSATAKFCGECGYKLEAAPVAPAVPAVEKLCPNCGENVGDAKFCNSCGTSLE